MTCKHENFRVGTNVHRLLKNEDDTHASAFLAEIKILCVDCGEPFEFIGVPMGYSPGQTCVSVDCLELRAAIKPKGEALDLTGMAGFAVRRTV